MEKFTRKNEFGLDVNYQIIAKTEMDGNVYIIYTDFVNDNTTLIGLRLFIDLVTNDGYKRLTKEEEKIILKDFNF